jgi:hypothetical protein
MTITSADGIVENIRSFLLFCIVFTTANKIAAKNSWLLIIKSDKILDQR